MIHRWIIVKLIIKNKIVDSKRMLVLINFLCYSLFYFFRNFRPKYMWYKNSHLIAVGCHVLNSMDIINTNDVALEGSNHLNSEYVVVLIFNLMVEYCKHSTNSTALYHAGVWLHFEFFIRTWVDWETPRIQMRMIPNDS